MALKMEDKVWQKETFSLVFWKSHVTTISFLLARGSCIFDKNVSIDEKIQVPVMAVSGSPCQGSGDRESSLSPFRLYLILEEQRKIQPGLYGRWTQNPRTTEAIF